MVGGQTSHPETRAKITRLQLGFFGRFLPTGSATGLAAGTGRPLSHAVDLGPDGLTAGTARPVSLAVDLGPDGLAAGTARPVGHAVDLGAVGLAAGLARAGNPGAGEVRKQTVAGGRGGAEGAAGGRTGGAAGAAGDGSALGVGSAEADGLAAALGAASGGGSASAGRLGGRGLRPGHAGPGDSPGLLALALLCASLAVAAYAAMRLGYLRKLSRKLSPWIPFAASPLMRATWPGTRFAAARLPLLNLLFHRHCVVTAPACALL